MSLREAFDLAQEIQSLQHFQRTEEQIEKLLNELIDILRELVE